MRELWLTGWMQQSVRMVAAAFLTEYLNLPWVEGARWFHDTLVDADAAINSMMWQNAGGWGGEGGGGRGSVKGRVLAVRLELFLVVKLLATYMHALFFSHSTPRSQIRPKLDPNHTHHLTKGKSGIDQWNFTLSPTSKYQDPDGSYIRRWLPELSQLPPSFTHAPWKAPPEVLKAAGVTLGVTYPHRIVTSDTAELRGANVRAIREARRLHVGEWSDARGYDLVVAPKVRFELLVLVGEGGAIWVALVASDVCVESAAFCWPSRAFAQNPTRPI